VLCGSAISPFLEAGLTPAPGSPGFSRKFNRSPGPIPIPQGEKRRIRKPFPFPELTYTSRTPDLPQSRKEEQVVAQVDYFLKIDGAEGESPDSKHKGEIEVLSFSWAVHQQGTSDRGGGAGAGKALFSDFAFVKKVDKSSPKIAAMCASGEPIANVVLTCRKAGKDQQEYLKIKFNDVLISSYQIGGSGGHEVIPNDSISLNFSKYEIEYKEQKPDGTLGGSVKAGYDIKQNQRV
jgi:type VI secretion system secreted protein Hcp